MADFIPTPQGVRAVLVYNWEGQTVENVLHFDVGGDVDDTILQDLADKLNAFWIASIMPNLSQGIQYLQCFTYDITTQTGAIKASSLGSTAGGDSSVALPLNAALCLTKRTALRGRSFRGRLYLPGLPRDQQIDSGHVSTTFASHMASQLAGLLTATGFSTYRFSVLSLSHNKVPRTAGALAHVIGVDANNAIDSMRKRLVGRGI